MNRYQLAKLVSWSNRLHTRKKLQKVAFLLQAAGCPFGVEYTLHHYGPYSEDLARLTDEMVRHSLLEEEAHDNSMGQQYSYRVSGTAQKQLIDLEATEQGQRWAAELAPFQEMAKKLLAANVKELEYASTIVFFRRQGCDWDAAVEKAAIFKNTQAVNSAAALAKSVIG
jgi:uncharacterized protein